MKKSDRFEYVESSRLGLGEAAMVVVDKKTGVNYLFVKSGYGGGLTVLVDKDGKPVITGSTENA